MRWTVAVSDWDGYADWRDCPSQAEWEPLVADAERRPQGQVEAHRVAASLGMTLVYNEHRGLVVQWDAAGLRRAVFPHRPPTPEDCGPLAVAPWEYLHSHGCSRSEAFGLLRSFMVAGELPAAVPRPAFEQPLLPGMEGFGPSPAEWRLVVWVSADVV